MKRWDGVVEKYAAQLQVRGLSGATIVPVRWTAPQKTRSREA